MGSIIRLLKQSLRQKLRSQAGQAVAQIGLRLGSLRYQKNHSKCRVRTAHHEGGGRGGPPRQGTWFLNVAASFSLRRLKPAAT